jgi:hypothetical protein
MFELPEPSVLVLIGDERKNPRLVANLPWPRLVDPTESVHEEEKVIGTHLPQIALEAGVSGRFHPDRNPVPEIFDMVFRDVTIERERFGQALIPVVPFLACLFPS